VTAPELRRPKEELTEQGVRVVVIESTARN